MKKITSIILALGSIATVYGQDTTKITATRNLALNINQDADLVSSDALAPKWSIIVNGMAGMWGEQKTPDGYTIYNAAAYKSGNIDKAKTFGKAPQFQVNGHIMGSNVMGGLELERFFGINKRFGVGLGVLYQQYTGSIRLDSFHVEYQSVDANGNTFRQLVSSGHPAENDITYTSWNIPVMFKYKHQFNRKNLGIYANAGGVFSVASSNTYATNARFDYEAIYKFDKAGNATYESSSTPAYTDVLITRNAYLAANADHNDINAVASEFATLRNNSGYNVGINMQPGKTSGTHSYKFGAGYLVQAGVSYRLGFKVTVDLGGYFMQQWFMNDNADKYTITDKVGDYNTLLASTKNISNASFGINLGVRYYLGRDQDKDGDGIVDKKDDCPNNTGLKQFCGCPDTDNDGIPDKEDRCPLQKGPECTAGCPDRDGDCVADVLDECPKVFGREVNGCPFKDKDHDGVPDSEDRCPDIAGLKENYGCPAAAETETHIVDTVYETPHVTLSVRTITFASNKATIDDLSEATLNEIAETMKQNPNTMMLISGYTDKVGGYIVNMELSFKRAQALKERLVKAGIDGNRIKVSGYGKKNPVSANNADNRRVEMELVLPLK